MSRRLFTRQWQHFSARLCASIYIKYTKARFSSWVNEWHCISEVHDEKIRRIVNSGNAHYSVQKLLLSHLLFKALKIKLYKTTILPVVSYNSEVSHLTLRECKLQTSENKMLKKVVRLTKEDISGEFKILNTQELCDS